MSVIAGRTFGIVGALGAFPRRLAAREVEAQGGRLRRAQGRDVTDIVLGRTVVLRGDDDAIAARVAAERAAGRRVLSEDGFLRLLGLMTAIDGSDLGRAALLAQSGLGETEYGMLRLFDAFEHDREPHSFRDLILARKYAGLVAGGAGWGDIVRAVHRSGGPIVSLTAQTLAIERGAVVCAGPGGPRAELDGQLRLGLEAAEEDAEELFAAAEAAEAGGQHRAAAELYHRCLALDPTDAVAAFNRANCLRAAGSGAEAVHDYARAIKLDPAFGEAWFNLAGLMRERGHPASARRYLAAAVARSPDYADAIYNLATLAFEAGDRAEAGRLWSRYVELDPSSDWGRRAARGLALLALERGAAG